MQGAAGSARRDRKSDKGGGLHAFFVQIGARGMEDGAPLRLDWIQPRGDLVLKRGPRAAARGSYLPMRRHGTARSFLKKIYLG